MKVEREEKPVLITLTAEEAGYLRNILGHIESTGNPACEFADGLYKALKNADVPSGDYGFQGWLEAD